MKMPDPCNYNRGGGGSKHVWTAKNQIKITEQFVSYTVKQMDLGFFPELIILKKSLHV